MQDGDKVIPRIRDLTGIRIHQLTLPESLCLASKLQLEDDVDTPLAGPSSPILSRTISHGAYWEKPRPTRERSSSSSMVPSSPRGPRRARAPTLAGEAMSLDRSLVVEKPVEQVRRRPLARCFIVLKLPKQPTIKVNPPRDALRQRTASLDNQRAAKDVPISRTSSDKARQRRSQKPTISRAPSITTPYSPKGGSTVPFYISPIHHRSVHPRFLSFSTDDFAPWLTVEESAGSSVELEVWYEDQGWRLFEGLPKEFDFARLKRLEKGETVEENTVLFNFRSDQGFYYLSDAESRVEGIVERSMRETKMRRGIGIGALHQLVNMQSVVADTKRGIEEVQRNIDRMLTNDVDKRAIRRDLSERAERCNWVREKIEEVSKTTREVSARGTLRQQALEQRRINIKQGQERLALLHAQALDLAEQVDHVDTERMNLLHTIHHYRTFHVQTLDSLFPILPLHPPTLLYSILDVPLPIPVGAKDPAPPLTIPSLSLDGIAKVDERTTAAALGYVAMVVQILGNLGGAIGGVPYPVTCAGSRSHVKDVVSVMQGPRSFPLYAKGVERYRYEYAVFLLNKNIETLMQEANIRLLDIRHTLPNLKILLLTLSSPIHLPYPTLSRSSTLHDSRASSRVTSATYGSGRDSPAPKVLFRSRQSLVEDDEKSSNDDAVTVSEV